MSIKRTEEQEKPTPAEEVRTALAGAARQWAEYWRASVALAWRTVFPPREDYQ